MIRSSIGAGGYGCGAITRLINFEQVARRYGVTEQIRYNETFNRCHYVDARWELTTSRGTALTADLVICATGILHHPVYPNINGLAQFAGPCFHTARWDHSVDLQGKRVGIIGTGSTACQVIPELQKTVSHLTVFQRTAQWVAPQPNVHLETGAITGIERDGVRTDDGHLHKLDALVLSTGFSPFDFMRPMDLRGRNGRSIDQAWRERRLDTIEASESAKQSFNAYLREGMGDTVWLGGCNSWYLDDDGDPVMWPYTWQQWRKTMATPDLQDFIRADAAPDVLASDLSSVA